MKAILQYRKGVLRRWHTEVYDDSELHWEGKSDFERKRTEIMFMQDWMIWAGARRGRRVRFEDSD